MKIYTLSVYKKLIKKKRLMNVVSMKYLFWAMKSKFVLILRLSLELDVNTFWVDPLYHIIRYE